MDSWKEVDKIAFDIPWLEIMYDSLRKETKATITFLQYATFRNPHWSKWDILQGFSLQRPNLSLWRVSLQDGMARSDFQWPGKTQGEIRIFSKVKRLIN
jgi:hypothetical protein